MTLSPLAQNVLKSVASVPFLYVGDIAEAVGASDNAVQTAAIELERSGHVRLRGPSNANEDRGFDIDRVEITSKGRMAVR